jgi:hypothetical protein
MVMNLAFRVIYAYNITMDRKGIKKGKANPVTGSGGPQACETPRLPHFLDNWPTDDEVVSLRSRPRFTARKIPGTHLC